MHNKRRFAMQETVKIRGKRYRTYWNFGFVRVGNRKLVFFDVLLTVPLSIILVID